MTNNNNNILTTEDFVLVTLPEYIFFSLITLGLFPLCWWYCNFMKLAERETKPGDDSFPAWIAAIIYALLTPLFSYLIFSDLEIVCRSNGVKSILKAGYTASLFVAGSLAAVVLKLIGFESYYVGQVVYSLLWVLVILGTAAHLSYVYYSGKLANMQSKMPSENSSNNNH